MMNAKNIIIIVALIAALGFLAFSVAFYMMRRGVTVTAPSPAVTYPTMTQTPGPAAVTYTEDWTEGFGQARLAMDPEKCSVIIDANARRDCQDRVNLLIAYRDNKLSLCQAIFNSSWRDNCYVNLGISLGVDYCKYLSSEINKKSCEDEKLLMGIVNSKDIAKCNNLAEGLKQTCAQNIISSYESVSQCAAIVDQEIRQMCQNYFQ